MQKGKRKMTGFLGILLSVVLLFGAATGLFFSYRAYQYAIHPVRYEEYVQKYASEYGVEVALIYAIIKTESNFYPEAVSVNDACGLMQLLPDTLDWLQNLTPENDQYRRADLFRPEINIRYGVFFLSVLLKEFSSKETAVAAYHAGINGVRGWLKNPDYSEDGTTLKKIPFQDTQQYVALIMQRDRAYQNLYDFSE